MDHKLTNEDLNQRDMTVATTKSSSNISRRTLLKTGTVVGVTLAISGCASIGEAQPDDVPPEDNKPKPIKSVDDIRVPQLHLHSLEAEVQGETLKAVSYEDWRSGSTTYIGQVTGIRGPDLFVGVSLPGDDADPSEEVVVYLCNGEIGAVPTIRIYQTGDYDTGRIILTGENEPPGNEQIETKLALVDGTVLGSLTLADGEPFPFIAHEATGDAGLYKAETEEGDLVAHWVVFPDGRERGGLDGKGNDVYPSGGSVSRYCIFGYCFYY